MTAPPLAENERRPYRSKRLRPCDVCRRRKTACRIDSRPPCLSCRDLRVDCLFEGPPMKRRARSTTQQDPRPVDQGPPFSIAEDLPLATLPGGNDVMVRHSSTAGHEPANMMAWHMDDLLGCENLTSEYRDAVPSPTPWLTMFTSPGGDMAPNNHMDLTWRESLPNQMAVSPHDAVDSASLSSSTSAVVKPLDSLDGFTAQYMGLSGETDPYLIRHFHFASEGEARFFKVHFRQVASDDNGTSNDVPTHFMITANELGEATKPETSHESDLQGTGKTKLDQLIIPEDGRRLVGLFLRFIFPSFPVISRSQLGLGPGDYYPDAAALAKVPPHLLAAIYAISVRFCHRDSVLCVSKVYYTKPAVGRLWRIALQEIMREIHTPVLSVFQAMLIYLQKPQSEETSAVADSPFRWSFMGFANSLASTLGLHLDCRQWPIPHWEKRLRRRLWWAFYAEATWRSLFQGFPNPIHDDHWNVKDLDGTDFVTDKQHVELGSTPIMTEQQPPDMDTTQFDFIYLAQLTRIASAIYWAFYTLKATQSLAKNFHLSLNVARPFRSQLTEWYSALPSQYKIMQDSASSMSQDRQGLRSAAYLQLSYLSLQLMIHRALLRPTGCVVPKKAPGPPDTGRHQVTDMFGHPERHVDPALDATLNAAESCAQLIITCTSNITSRDIDSFWFPWTRIYFATMSNFAVTLLIQAPSLPRAQVAKRIVDDWRSTLLMHSQTFDLVRLGLLRLNAMHWVGLRQLSRASLWADEVIRNQEQDQ